MSHPRRSVDTEPSTTAARALAQVLTDQARALSSDDLVTVSAAMSAVRAAARQLESSLTQRGWGGDVLYGWGDPSTDQPYDEVDDDGEDPPEDEPSDAAPPLSTVRLSCQSRFDFYLLDEDALTAYTLRRAAERGLAWDHEWLREEGPFAGFSYLYGLDSVDLDGTGLAQGGGQVSVRQVSSTLWELHETDPGGAEDAFPTTI